MAKKINLFCISIFLVFNSLSQLNYIEYHKVISNAEKLVLTENYTQALNKYDSVFQIYPTAFSKDLYNAAICAVYTKNYVSSKKYLLQLSNLGVKKKWVKKRIFFPLRLQDGWRKFRKEYNHQLKQAYLKRKNDNEYNYLKSLNEPTDTSDSDSTPIKKLIQYIEKNEYPNEGKVLVTEPGELCLPYNLLHQSFNNNTELLNNLLLEQVKKGLLHPYVLASFVDLNYKKLKLKPIYGSTVFIELKKDIFSKHKASNLTKENIDWYTENRIKLGLDDYRSYVSKITNKRKLKPFIFMTYSGIYKLNESTSEKRHFSIKTKNGIIIFF